MSLFVNPAQFGGRARPRALPARRGARPRLRRASAGVDLVFAPSARRDVPARLPDLGRRDRGRLDPRRAVPPRALPRRRNGRAQALLDRPPHARVLRPEGRPAGRGDPDADPRPRARGRAAGRPDRPRSPTASRSRRATRSSRRTSARRALALPRALATRDREQALAELASANGLEIDYVEVADFDPPVPRRRRPRRLDPPHRQRRPRRRRPNEHPPPEARAGDARAREAPASPSSRR